MFIFEHLLYIPEQVFHQGLKTNNSFLNGCNKGIAFVVTGVYW